MAIQTINLTVPGGDTPRSANTKINANFSDQTNAASKLVGTAAGNVMQVGAFGIGEAGQTPRESPDEGLSSRRTGFYSYIGDSPDGEEYPWGRHMSYIVNRLDAGSSHYILIGNTTGELWTRTVRSYGSFKSAWIKHWSQVNTKLDTNGAISPSSPTIDLYSDRIETNYDGERMNPEFVRNGVGDYTIKNTTGLRDEGWYIKIPNDMNGNPKVAVAIDTDKDGNLSIKTYKRTFSLETFIFGPDLEQPLDIPEGRWIDLRFNDLPQETPTDLDKTNL